MAESDPAQMGRKHMSVWRQRRIPPQDGGPDDFDHIQYNEFMTTLKYCNSFPDYISVKDLAQARFSERHSQPARKIIMTMKNISSFAWTLIP